MLDAGSVVTTLGGRLDKSAFAAYDAENKKAIASAARAEAAMTSSGQRAARAHDDAASAAGRAAAANDRLATSGRRLSGSLPLAAMDQLSKHSDQAGKNLSKLGTVAAKGTGVGLATLAVATIYAAKTAGDFEKQMRNVNSIAKLSEAGYRSLSKGVLSLAGDTAQAPKVLAEGLYQLVSSGFSAKDSLTILQSSAKAATAGLTDTATATTAVAAVLNAYREPAGKASQVSDVLFETVNRGVLTFAELSKEIGTVLPFAASLGVALPEVGAAVSTMTKEGISAPETMTRIKQSMVAIIKPSVDMKKAIAETGASSGQALVKQKGFQGALEALIKTTDGSKESLAKLFPNIRALGGVLALTGNNAKSAQQDLKAFQDTGGATAKVFAEQSKGAEFAGKQLLSSLETAAIVVGDKVLPVLAEGAHELTGALQGAIKDGSLERFGHSALSIFETLGTVVGNVAPVIAGVAKSLVELGGSLGLGNASELTALLAAFATFKGVSFVAPILASAAGAISEVGLAAATAPSVAAFAADLVAMVGPAGLIAGGLALAAGAFVAFNTGLFDGASAAEKNASALRADKAAMESLNSAITAAARGEIEAKQAKLDQKAATEALAKVEKEHREGKASEQQVEQARINRARANISVQESTAAALAKVNTVRKEAEKREGTTGKRSEQLEGEKQGLEESIRLLKASGQSRQDLAGKLRALTSINNEYNASIKRQVQANAEVSVAEISRIRAQHSLSQIKPANAQGVSDLQVSLSGLPKKIVTRYELEDQDTIAKLGVLSSKLEQIGQGATVVKVLTNARSASVALAGLTAVAHNVPAQKVLRIIHNAPSAKSAISQLHSAINAVPPSKRVTVSTNAAAARAEISAVQGSIDALHGKSIFVTVQKAFTTVETTIKKAITGHASGRRSGAREPSIVGEGNDREYVIDRRTGAGQIVSRPTLMGLGADDYVVPLEERYRGRAMGLFSMLARDLEVPGYKKGKAAKPKHAYKIPKAIEPLSLPVQEIETKRDAVKTAQDKTQSDVKSENSKIASLEKSIRTGERAKKPNRAKLSELHGELKKIKHQHEADAQQLAKDKRGLQEWNRTVRAAKAFQGQIDRRTLEANNAGNAMKLAAGRDDLPGYEAAKGRRLGALGALKQLIGEAQKQVKSGSEYALDLEGKVQGYEEEAQTTAGEALEPVRNKAAEEEESTGETAAERAEQKRIEAGVALAALTPDLGDDKAAAQQLVDFFGRVLGEVQAEPGARGGDESIRNIADSLKTAQNNLASLSGSGTNENADLQAQITQANERAEAQKLRADTNERALQVFGGAGDIGAGGSNAAKAAAGATVNVYTLHPGDPATLRAIGAAATAGIGLQGSRQAPRVQVGP
jgi:TP901 family phage tail tape measure protein